MGTLGTKNIRGVSRNEKFHLENVGRHSKDGDVILGHLLGTGMSQRDKTTNEKLNFSRCCDQ